VQNKDKDGKDNKLKKEQIQKVLQIYQQQDDEQEKLNEEGYDFLNNDFMTASQIAENLAKLGLIQNNDSSDQQIHIKVQKKQIIDDDDENDDNFDDEDDPNDEDYDYYGRNKGKKKKKKQQKATISSTKQSVQSEFKGKKSPVIPTLKKLEQQRQNENKKEDNESERIKTEEEKQKDRDLKNKNQREKIYELLHANGNIQQQQLMTQYQPPQPQKRPQTSSGDENLFF
ncbi:MAG: hypothetical protein EZS28_054333, partial [Streblomastix strix]